MTALLVVMLIVVGGLLAWVVKLLLNMPQGGASGAPARPVFKNNFMEETEKRDSNAIDDAAERTLRRIDRKIDILKELIKQADQRIEELKKGGFILPAEYPEINAGNGAEARRPQRRGAFASQQAGSNAASDRNIDDDRRSKIVALKRKGRTSTAIAREVGMGLGEVELILKIEGY